MRVDELFPPEVIDEDIRKWMDGAALAGTIALGAGVTPQSHEPVPKPAVSAQASKAAQDVDALAKTMWGEARSHGIKGMLAVGYVIKNRAQSSEEAQHHFKFGGHDIPSVTMKSKQFSCWNPNDPNNHKIGQMKQLDQFIKTRTAPPGAKSFDEWFAKFKNTGEYADYKAWVDAFSLARDILSGKIKDPTNGAVFYHTTNVHPKWASAMSLCGRVGDHLFYRIPHTQV